MYTKGNTAIGKAFRIFKTCKRSVLKRFDKESAEENSKLSMKDLTAIKLTKIVVSSEIRHQIANECFIYPTGY